MQPFGTDPVVDLSPLPHPDQCPPNFVRVDPGAALPAPSFELPTLAKPPDGGFAVVGGDRTNSSQDTVLLVTADPQVPWPHKRTSSSRLVWAICTSVHWVTDFMSSHPPSGNDSNEAIRSVD